MKRIALLAGLALTAVSGISTTAEAQRRFDDRRYEDYRPTRPYQVHSRTWQDGWGRTCYMRSDGVRRCEHRGYQQRYDRHRERRYY